MKRLQRGTEEIAIGTGGELDPGPAGIAEAHGCTTGKGRRRHWLCLHPVDGSKGITSAWNGELPLPPVKRGEGHTLAPAERGDAQTRGNLPCQQTEPARGTIGNRGLHHAAIVSARPARAPSGRRALLKR